MVEKIHTNNTNKRDWKHYWKYKKIKTRREWTKPDTIKSYNSIKRRIYIILVHLNLEQQYVGRPLQRNKRKFKKFSTYALQKKYKRESYKQYRRQYYLIRRYKRRYNRNKLFIHYMLSYL